MRKLSQVFVYLLAFGLMMASPLAFGQASVSGSIRGEVTDPSGLALAKAMVKLQNIGTGAVQSGKVDSRGEYDFNLLPPGTYSLLVTASGFQTQAAEVTVAVGEVTPKNFKLPLATSSQTVEVSGGAPPLLQTETATTSHTLGAKAVSDLPVPGSDINYLALLAPGAEMVGGGSFPSVFGMPTNSNMYTVDGMEDIDPWNNGTNGGASNLLLGLNDVQQSTETSNGFNGKYGTLAGSNVNMVTKSGTNQFHGNLIWNWAGRALEANNFFRNAKGESRPFVNSNQWAGSIGGPIWHNKLFFFFDSEGIALVLPGSEQAVYVPTTQFQSATITNLTALGLTSEIPFYQQMFKLYNSAPGASTAAATPIGAGEIGGGCGTFTGLGAGVPCSNTFYSAQTNTSHEIINTFRIDYNLGPADHAYFHYLIDHGVQDTGVDPINPAFNAISKQPQYQGQFSETHTFGSSAVNQFQAAAQHYSALFEPTSLAAALATFPTTLQFGDSSLTALGGTDNSFPEGRNVTRYQFSDDYSHLWGNHSFQTGVYFSRYDATDFNFGNGTSGLMTALNLDAFYNGGYDPAKTSNNTTFTQSFPLSLQQPLAMYRLGLYAQDNWHVRRNLSLNLALRVDHPSNPVCQTGCFADTAGFLAIAHGAGIPYNQSITTGLKTGLPGLQALEWQPRAGFAWTPSQFGGNLVVRGGFGLFADSFPLVLITGFASNPPEDPSFTATQGYIAPNVNNSLYSQVVSSNQALQSGFANGATLAQLQASNPGFSIPNLTSSDPNLLNPTYYKWNLDIQRALWTGAALDVSYNGNHGVHELIQNQNVNAFDPNGFVGLPTAPVDPRFLQVTDYQSDGISNYNGMTATLNDRFKAGTLMLTYTWSHSLDTGYGTGGTRTTQFTGNPRLDYGPADFDYRHYASATYVWDVPLQQWFGGSNALTGGWEVTGNVIARSGGPIYVYNTNGTLGNDGYGAHTLANYLGGVVSGSCQNSDTPCFTKTEFSAATTGFSTTQSRNMFRGPGFWDTNLSLSKHFAVPGWERGTFEVAANAYNVFNHPNFSNPINNLSSGVFGTITSMQGVSSSPLGSNGADTSPRIVQLKLGLNW
jgi:hypothetical protein